MVFILNPGFYINLFEILFPETETEVMVCERSKYLNLKELREEINRSKKDIKVYAPEGSDKIFGYGKEKEWLLEKCFRIATVNLYDEPRLTSRMITEGIINKVKEIGYWPINTKEKGRIKLFNDSEFKMTSNAQIKIYLGYDIRVIFVKDMMEDILTYGLIIDVCNTIKDTDERSLNYSAVISKYGRDVLREIRQIQKDLVLTGINREVSKQRLIEDIIPFVKKIEKVVLPCEIEVEVSDQPTNIVLGDRDEFVW